MMITANELKVKGVQAFAHIVDEWTSAFISVRGKPKYIIMTKERYDDILERETLLAWKEAKEDIKNGDFHTGTVEEHLKEIGIK